MATEAAWRGLEDWLTEIAAGKQRRTGGPMVHHWIRIGRSLRAAGKDDITICGGYGHDIIEDLPAVKESDIVAFFEVVLGNANDAAIAVQLVRDCSYSMAEYELERAEAAVNGMVAGKDARKAMASARWSQHPDPRVIDVKIADIDDNDIDCDSVSADFAMRYRKWALPLREALRMRRQAVKS